MKMYDKHKRIPITNLEFPCGHIQVKKYHTPQVSEPATCHQ